MQFAMLPRQLTRASCIGCVPAVHSKRGCVRTRASAELDKPFINVISGTKWMDGVPPVMGAHLMASGEVAPVSVSKGPGIDVTPHMFQYHNKASDCGLMLHVTPEAASTGLAKVVAEAAAGAIKKKGSFTLVLSGGSLINSLSALTKAKNVDWEKFWVFYVDERNVPHSSSDSTHKGANELFLSKVPIPAAQIFAIAENLPVEQAATNYEGRLLGLPTSILPRTAGHLPVFDMILLGVGPDGHIASLFPNRPETAAEAGWVLPVKNSPKPPPERITFTLPVINSATDVVFLALGEGKAEIVQRVLEVQSLPGALPAQLVRPSPGRVRWILDVPAASKLDIAAWEEGNSFPRSVYA